MPYRRPTPVTISFSFFLKKIRRAAAILLLLYCYRHRFVVPPGARCESSTPLSLLCALLACTLYLYIAKPRTYLLPITYYALLDFLFFCVLVCVALVRSLVPGPCGVWRVACVCVCSLARAREPHGGGAAVLNKALYVFTIM